MLSVSMLNVSYKPFIFSVFMLNVTYKQSMLSVVMLSVIMLSVDMLNVTYKLFMLSVVMLGVAPGHLPFVEELLTLLANYFNSGHFKKFCSLSKALKA
jgi:hypothetical protein